MDWSDEEMEQLQNLSVRYSGVTTLYDELSINENQYSLSQENLIIIMKNHLKSILLLRRFVLLLGQHLLLMLLMQSLA